MCKALTELIEDGKKTGLEEGKSFQDTGLQKRLLKEYNLQQFLFSTIFPTSTVEYHFQICYNRQWISGIWKSSGALISFSAQMRLPDYKSQWITQEFDDEYCK